MFRPLPADLCPGDIDQNPPILRRKVASGFQSRSAAFEPHRYNATKKVRNILRGPY